MMRACIIADNQDITKAGLLYLMDKMPAFSSVTEAADKKELLQQLLLHPDALVLLDYTLFDLTGVNELLVLQERFKQVAWILFSDELSEPFIKSLIFSSPAFSILLKEASQEEIVAAFRSAGSSQPFICSRVKHLLAEGGHAQSAKEPPVLTATEVEILKAIALGKTTKEMAAERFSSVHTITTHRKNIFRKLEVNTIHEATRYALRAGIVDAAEYYI